MTGNAKKRKIVLIGASMRAGTCVKALKSDYAGQYEIVAILDNDTRKSASFNKIHELDVPEYSEVDFTRMLTETKPDIALITTIDSAHEKYIVNCLDNKISCFAEKPLCTTAEQCRNIIAAQKRNPDVYAVTMHNSRYHKTARKLKELVDSGVVGRTLSINYDEKLDLFHGASYFRRWNRNKALSGGLQLSKSCHHFDKVNWLTGQKPESVIALGGLSVYGAKNSEFSGRKCSICPHKNKCAFFIDLTLNPPVNDMYFQDNGSLAASYTPDQCVFDSEIDAEDNFCTSCRYEDGTLLTYTLCAYSKYEGETIHIEGEKGRLEMTRHTYRKIVKQGYDETIRQNNTLKLIRFGKEEIETFNVDDESSDMHGGSDKLIYADLFGGANSGALATLEDGIQAALIGIATNESMANKTAVMVQELL